MLQRCTHSRWRRGRPLGVRGRPDREAPPHGQLRRHDHVRDLGRGQGGHQPCSAVHRRVHGTAPDGPLVRRFGPGAVDLGPCGRDVLLPRGHAAFRCSRLTKSECDAYFDETSPVAIELGPSGVPRSVDETDAYFMRVRQTSSTGGRSDRRAGLLVAGVARKPRTGRLRVDRRGRREPPAALGAGRS